MPDNDPPILESAPTSDAAVAMESIGQPVTRVVAVGASAGGLKALTSLFADLPAQTGLAWVVIQHLDPYHASHLPALLARGCRLPMCEATDGTLLLVDHVYVISPNTTLRIAQGALRASPREEGPYPHLSIDACFTSLAQDQGNQALGVVLSGEGSDGTQGVSAIRAVGGLTFAQDSTAEHQTMPQSAINQGHVDVTLPPAEIAAQLCLLAREGRPVPVCHTSAESSQPPPHASAPLPDDPESYAVIMGQLRQITGIDFAHYRSSTILRRTVRRMAMAGCPTLESYVALLGKNSDEIESLARDILIHVTSFYRDKSAFEVLATRVFPTFLVNRKADVPIRLWVVGCSTGQEVYSLAMELSEFINSHLIQAASRPQIQIFASDISEWALNRARIGWYPESVSDQIPAERLARYFTSENTGFRITKNIRDLCVFARHDVTADVPFSHIDVISCRNVLIYLGPELQRRVLPTFHFSLRPGGYLLLGTSESIGHSVNLFEATDEKTRLYRSLPVTGKTRHILPSMTLASRPASMSIVAQLPMSDDQRTADQIILSRFAPASVLVTATLEVLQYRGNTSPFLQPAAGEASLNLLTMIPFGVAEALREAMAEASERGLPIRRDHIVCRRDLSFREIGVEVIPVQGGIASGTFLILFNEGHPERAVIPALPPSSAATESDEIAISTEHQEIAQLRDELSESGYHVQSLVQRERTVRDQMQGMSDELKAAKDESQSLNEEFRSTNEELQTAKEEVDSSNEELITINDELRAANDDLAKVSADLRAAGELNKAIVETMRYPLLTLNAALVVESANQAFLDAFRVQRVETVGRHVYDLGNREWNIPELRRLLEEILPRDSAFDDFEVTHDFRDIGHRTMLLNARRLHKHGDQTGRIVLVFADVTDQARITKDLKDLSNDLARSNAELDQFASVASHDLQEPVRMMSNYIALLRRRYDSMFDDKAREYMSYVSDGAQRMTEMIRAILVYSRVGHQSPQHTLDESSTALRISMENLHLKISESYGTITADSLPRIRASHLELTQIFQNLLSNALKFCRSDCAPVVHISAVRSDSEWTFSVTDNGIGMEHYHLDKIFGIFQRLPTEKKYPGTGIGLATCKKIVDHHHGRIWVQSEMNRGSTFFFTIPHS